MMLTKKEWKKNLTARQYEAAEENLFEAVDGYNGIENEYSSEEVFSAILDWEGINGYRYWLESLIENVYGVKLSELNYINTFYFTYGKSEQFPFKGGWTTVLADNRRDAIKKFRIRHPDKTEGLINCSDIYTKGEFRLTSMLQTGNLGEYEHEVII